jgi:fructan beta-fructosidase
MLHRFNYPTAITGTFLFLSVLCKGQDRAVGNYDESLRERVHFSPLKHWMNDPNGMVYYRGVYHLYFQYYPGAEVWGPMHWGHATSNDLVHWKEQPIAIYPDSLGYIFSGSAVLDMENSSGFGTKQEPSLVAIFTQHDPQEEKSGRNDFQNQSIAYSNDGGSTWTKYASNPVIKNPGIRDFRDPKLTWYAPAKKWIATLAIGDHIGFYSSKDLKTWTLESEFGKNAGCHAGVWECPDLFQLRFQGNGYWVVTVSVNPGGPNKGSATQYFIGQFDGHRFEALSDSTKWIDYGPDSYAGVSWSNTGNRKIYLAWMSNWLYADKIPSQGWRNSMTIPRELHLEKIGTRLFLGSLPVAELNNLNKGPVDLLKQDATGPNIHKSIQSPFLLKLKSKSDEDFCLKIKNEEQEWLLIGYDHHSNRFYIDRSQSGATHFQPDFIGRSYAPRISTDSTLSLQILIDRASVEIFADGGLTVLSTVFFPTVPFGQMDLSLGHGKSWTQIDYQPLESIWKAND